MFYVRIIEKKILEDKLNIENNFNFCTREPLFSFPFLLFVPFFSHLMYPTLFYLLKQEQGKKKNRKERKCLT